PKLKTQHDYLDTVFATKQNISVAIPKFHLTDPQAGGGIVIDKLMFLTKSDGTLHASQSLMADRIEMGKHTDPSLLINKLAYTTKSVTKNKLWTHTLSVLAKQFCAHDTCLKNMKLTLAVDKLNASKVHELLKAIFHSTQDNDKQWQLIANVMPLAVNKNSGVSIKFGADTKEGNTSITGNMHWLYQANYKIAAQQTLAALYKATIATFTFMAPHYYIDNYLKLAWLNESFGQYIYMKHTHAFAKLASITQKLIKDGYATRNNQQYVMNINKSQTAISINNKTPDSVNKGYVLLNLGLYKASFVEFLQAAKEGNIDAKRLLGIQYLHGLGVTKSIKDGVDWMIKAAKDSNVMAQIDLGVMYYKGKNVQQDYQKALHWLDLAANTGNPLAEYILGHIYYLGMQTPYVARNLNKAIYWLEKAAEQKYTKAEHDLKMAKFLQTQQMQEKAKAA
ncbi:MAG: hypothetical protein COB50_01970, partial [Thiotrichales bacterium]